MGDDQLDDRFNAVLVIAEALHYDYRSRQLRPLRNLVGVKDQFLSVPVPAVERHDPDFVTAALAGFYERNGREEFSTEPPELVGQLLLRLWVAVRRQVENAIERYLSALALGHDPPQHFGHDPVRVPFRHLADCMNVWWFR